ncbi:hypothetical protein [Actinomadura sp. HBU206391]|uniref:hypothetical protein n=1 Tax=Actinomadura sp. HBU206391 TaxID=2731692 RepID=UPI001650103C|nr:hypothetical protein [Actinomadura sp. HBU206391]MBC6459292.1 hypothetical protein [Actinomadura sp. HBU206391]
MTTFALIAAALVMGCGAAPQPAGRSATSAPPVPSSRTSSPAGAPAADGAAPRFADQLVLRWRLTGGLAGRGAPSTPPDFSLYGDGRAIAADRETAPALREYRLTPVAHERLLQDARAIGLDRPRRLDQPGVADAFTLSISFGRAETHVVVAGSGESDPAVRFARERLDPRRWAEGDQRGAARPYEPERLALLASEVHPADGQRSAARWPLGPIGRGVPAAGARCAVVSGPDVAAATRLSRTARPGTRWLSGGRTYVIRLRPLLPDERTCADLARS